MGRLRTSSTVITPPSQRMTISGLLMSAFLMLWSVMVAASSILGMMLALITAVRVRTFRPYSLEISLVAVAGRPISPQISTTRFSFFGSSTLKASAATKVCAPCSCSFRIAARMLPSRSGVLVSTYSLQLRRYLPSDSSMSPMVVSPLLFAPCRPLPSVMMPTGATSPSSRALVACVVPWAMKMTSSGRISHCSMTLCSTCTMPAATPSAAVWVVGTFTLPTTSKVSLSMATASVKVPPTSIPIRTFIKQKPPVFPFSLLLFEPGQIRI